jgi:predicted ArsR family transcriptional regulator
MNSAEKQPVFEKLGAETSDAQLVDLLRRQGALGVTELAEATGVTATAVRQRLTRLLASGLIERVTRRAGRGRPSHRYSLTAKGTRECGTNYPDLATALWDEVRAIRDPATRDGLLRRLAVRLADDFGGQAQGSLDERMNSLLRRMEERRVPFAVDQSGGLPVLTALACPYPDLAEQDRSVCAMERMMFSEVLGESVKLTSCRLDGATCCTFEASAGKTTG